MINISRKDRSMILLIASSLIIFWLISAVFSSLFGSLNFKNSELAKLKNHENSSWLNSSRAITAQDLENRIVIVHFFTQSCQSCIQGLNQLNKFADEVGNKVAIIGVNSPKFIGEKSLTAAKKAVLRYNINHPIVVDSDNSISESFQVKEWPTYLLFNIRGNLVKTYSKESSAPELIKKAANLIKKNRFSLASNSLPIILEKNNIALNVLNYPTKLLFVQNFEFKNRNLPVIIIANTGKNSIIVANLKGEIILHIGSEKQGFVDGSFESARFNSPQGILYSDNKIFIADTLNHSVRVADLKNNEVKTIIGSGFAGKVLNKKKIKVVNSADFELSSPSDLEFFPNSQTITIANSATNQIMSYNLSSKEISPLVGSGNQGRVDGKFPANSLSQPIDMAVFNNKLYFLDSLSSSLRSIDENGNLQTLHTGTMFDSIKKEFKSSLMQSPRALYADDTGIYIADSLNHKIRKYDFSSGQIYDLFGLNRGSEIGNRLSLDEPQGLTAIFNHLYIADTNNNRIIAVNRGSRNAELFDVFPVQNLTKLALLEFIPNLDQEPQISVKENQKISFKIKLKNGWKINEMAASYLNFLELKTEKNAVLLNSFNANSIKSNQIELPPMKSGEEFMLYGKIYFCKEGLNSLCFVKSYQQPIIANPEETNNKIELNLQNSAS